MAANQRYFLECSYNGAEYYGWQKQPGQISVQETLEDALTTILGQIVEVTGCGRTDTGVHAAQYYAHFNFAGPFPPQFLRRLNKFLPPDLAVRRIFPVHWDAHARYDAYHRAYEYHLTFSKDPFRQKTATYYPYARVPELPAMQEAASLLLEYREFFPFCKSNNQAKTMICDLRRSEWTVGDHPNHYIYHIAANRFLRGMVRLIVGMCINVGTGKLHLATVRKAMDQQIRLERSTSAPAAGLFLTDIRYPFLRKDGTYRTPDGFFTPREEE